MLDSTRPCTETVAEPGVPGGALVESQPVSATTAMAAAMILMVTLRTSRLLSKTGRRPDRL
jgi:hypothetical protein